MDTTFLKTKSCSPTDRRAKNFRDTFQAQRIRSHRSNPANRSRQRGPLASSCEIGEGQRVQGYLPLLAKEAKLVPASVKGIAVNMVKEDGAIGRFTAVFAKGGSDESRLKTGKENATTLTIPASRKSQTLQVIRFSGKGEGELLAFASYLTHLQKRKTLPNLNDKIKGGPHGGRKSSRPKGRFLRKRNLRPRHTDPTRDSFRKDR